MADPTEITVRTYYLPEYPNEEALAHCVRVVQLKKHAPNTLFNIHKTQWKWMLWYGGSGLSLNAVRTEAEALAAMRGYVSGRLEGEVTRALDRLRYFRLQTDRWRHAPDDHFSQPPTKL